MKSETKKGPSLMGAVLRCKCPSCREGNLFPVPVSSFRKLTDVNEQCPVCGEILIPEPDFFYGAMYISYGMSVALFISVMVALNVLFDEPSLTLYIGSVVSANLLLLPFMLRYSKVLYLYALGRINYSGN